MKLYTQTDIGLVRSSNQDIVDGGTLYDGAVVWTDLCDGMGSLYEIISESRETTYGAVERGIRSAITKASRESDWWIKMGLSQRTTNGKFLSSLALLMKRESQK